LTLTQPKRAALCHSASLSPSQEATLNQGRFFLLKGEKAMTLKSFNTRHVKPIRKIFLFGASLLLAAVSLLGPTRWCAEATGFNRRPVEADNSIPALQGAAGITYLKEHNLYDSLRAASKAAHIDEQKLTASDGAFNDIFGDSVAVSGSTIVVGARGDDNLRGSAYVFERHGGSWVETQKLIGSGGSVFDFFGKSVAISGSTIVAGAPNRRAYVFNHQGGSWVETQKLTASSPTANDCSASL
jgi:hypothetical protein